MLSFKCRNVGMDCDFESTVATETELMKNIMTHALAAHKMVSIPPDILAKITAAIKK